MAAGRQRCMYCEDSQGTDIDHFCPKSEYPLGTFDWGNLLLACSYCNSNAKRTEFPRDEEDEPLLIDPTSEDPFEHLTFVPDTGTYQPQTTKGEETCRVFALNRQILSQGRHDAWVILSELVPRLALARAAGREELVTKLMAVVVRLSFSAVLLKFRATANSDIKALLLI
ncbi:MAG TPA: HNH endonuclease [Polyangia bacterium]|nr:HNH endonuclease [Polyangia bacterium]